MSPVRQLKKVDLPAPFGPISPRMSPSSTETEASSTALKAPKALVMRRASISMAARLFNGLGDCRLALEQRPGPARQETRDDHDDRAVDDVGEARALAAEVGIRQFLERHQDQRADQ